MLTIIELPLQILEMTQSSTFMEHWTFREHEIQKGGPQIMTSWYDDVVPGMLPIYLDTAATMRVRLAICMHV